MSMPPTCISSAIWWIPISTSPAATAAATGRPRSTVIFGLSASAMPRRWISSVEKYSPLGPMLCPIVLALRSVALNASAVLMSGFGAPARTARPTRERNASVIVPVVTLPTFARLYQPIVVVLAVILVLAALALIFLQVIWPPPPPPPPPPIDPKKYAISISKPFQQAKVQSPTTLMGTLKRNPSLDGLQLWLFSVGARGLRPTYWPYGEIKIPDKVLNWSLEYKTAPGDRVLQLYLVGKDGQALVSSFFDINRPFLEKHGGSHQPLLGITSDIIPACAALHVQIN